MTAAVQKPPVTYHRLTRNAREQIKWSMPIAEYVRYFYPSGEWGGDSCGCPDDRCKDGYHHEPWGECDCLTACIAEVV